MPDVLADFQIDENALLHERRFGLICSLCKKALELRKKTGKELSIIVDDEKTKNGLISFNVYESSLN